MATLKTYSIVSDITGQEVNHDTLKQALKDSGDIVNFNGLVIRGDSIEVVGDSFTEANVDAIILAHEAVSLAEHKQVKFNAIDYKTGTLIAPGFTYDSQVFSTSVMAQQNWSEIHSNTSEFADPCPISTKDNNEYSLAHANVNAFWTTGKDFVQGHLDSGRALKKSVFDAVDKAGVDAVVDNR